jgi:spermidine/putrescine transport system permease protein
MNYKYAKWLFGVYTTVVFAFLLIPPLFIVYQSFFPTPSPAILIPEEFTLKWYYGVFEDDTLKQAITTSLIVSLSSAILTATISVLGARGYMKLPDKYKEPAMLVILLPVFVPAIVFGLALLVFLQTFNVPTGTATLVLAGMLWSVPFAMLIMLTTMSNLRANRRRASYDLGASEFYTFRKIEWPDVYPGAMGAFLFPFLLTFNEYIRSSFVSGRDFTIPVFIYSHVGAGGIPPELFSFGAIAILVTTILMSAYVIYFRMQSAGPA